MLVSHRGPDYKNCNCAPRALTVAADQVAMQKKPERAKDGRSQSSILFSKQTLKGSNVNSSTIFPSVGRYCGRSSETKVMGSSSGSFSLQNTTRTAPEAASSSEQNPALASRSAGQPINTSLINHLMWLMLKTTPRLSSTFFISKSKTKHTPTHQILGCFACSEANATRSNPGNPRSTRKKHEAFQVSRLPPPWQRDNDIRRSVGGSVSQETRDSNTAVEAAAHGRFNTWK